MPPKRPIHDSNEIPNKRLKGESSQRSLETFFGAGAISRSRKTKPNSARRPREIIVIDDSDDDDVDIGKSGPVPTTLSPEIKTAGVEQAGLSVNLSNSGDSRDDLLEYGLSSSQFTSSTSGPGGPVVVVDDVSSVMSYKRSLYYLSNADTLPNSSPRLTEPRASSPGPNKFAVSDFPTLSVDPLVFDPCSNLKHSPWWIGEKGAPYSLLVHALQTLTSTRSRIAILSTLTNVLRILISHDPESILPALYLLSNSLAPPWEGIELGVGGNIISKTLQTTTSITHVKMRELYKQHGDPGDVAYYAVVGTSSGPRTSVLKPHPPLLIRSLYQDLRRIASAKGEGRQNFRQAITERLILSAVGSSWKTGKSDTTTDRNRHLIGEEPRYLVRTLVQNLRVGAVRTTILNALARAFVLTQPRNQRLSSTTESSLSISVDDLQCIKSVLGQQTLQAASMRKGKQKPGQSEAFSAAHEMAQAVLKRAESLLRRAYAQHPSFDDVVVALLRDGIDCVVRPRTPIGLTLGIPLMPTLGSPMRSLDDIYDRLGPNASWTAEMKYDGQRAQLHAWREGMNVNVKIFSRHLEDMTDKYPDLVQLIGTIFASDQFLQSFVVDAEAVAIDPKTGDLRSFQELAGRARKEVKVANVKVTVCLFLFDMMLLNGESLIQEPFRERRRLLRTHLPPVRQFMSTDDGASSTKVVQASLDHVESIEADRGREAVEEFWEKAVESKCEGLMIKLLDDAEVFAEDDEDEDADPRIPQKGKKFLSKGSRRKALPATYEPDKRTSAWLKLKKDYVEGVGDSLDLVPIGAWHGNGRKAAWWSPILMAVYDPERDIFVALCKCMSGFTDAFYKNLNDRYVEGSEVCSTSSRWNVETGGYQPSVYFKPSEVWEMRGADFTISPNSVAALGMVPQAREKGLSLRFPRFIRKREDKPTEMANTPGSIVELWHLQERKGENGIKGADDGELLDYMEEEEIEEEYDSGDFAA